MLDRRALYNCIGPWAGALRSLGPLQRDLDAVASGKLGDPRLLWIRCTPARYEMFGSTQSPISPRTLEGLALLTLLARVDAGLWRSALNDVWGLDSWSGEKTRAFVYGELTRLTTGTEAEAFAIGVALTVSSRKDLERATNQCLRPENFSDGMKHVLKMLNVAIAPEDEGVRIPVKYLVDFSESEENITDTLQAIIDIKHSEQTRDHHSVRFEIVCIKQFMTAPDVAGLELMAKLRFMRVRLDHLPPLDHSCSSLDHATQLTSALRSLLLKPPEEFPDMKAPGIDAVTVSNTTPVGLVDAVLSAVQVSPIVRSVSVNFDAEGRDQDPGFQSQQLEMWKIVARTLFSGHAQHFVDSLSLHVGNFTEEQLNAVVLSLGLDNTPTHAYPENVKEGPGRRITARRFHMRPIKGAKRRTSQGDVVYESAEPLELQVKRARFTINQRQWVSVTLPGRGEAWVEQHDTLATSVVENNYKSVYPKSFKNLALSYMTDSSKWKVETLLQQIGRGITALKVGEHMGRESLDEWMEAVFTSCSRVEDVEFGYAPLDSLDVFVERVGHPWYGLRRLCLPFNAFHPRDIKTFLEALCDPKHPLSSLEELTLRLKAGGQENYDEDEDEEVDDDEDDSLEETLAPVVQMLDTNRTLRNVVLRFELPGHEEDSQKEAIEEIFERQMDEDQEPWIRTGPLDERSTLAFLSVFHGERPSRSSVLDSSVLAMILDFAAPSVQREFNLEIRAGDSY